MSDRGLAAPGKLEKDLNRTLKNYSLLPELRLRSGRFWVGLMHCLQQRGGISRILVVMMRFDRAK